VHIAIDDTYGPTVATRSRYVTGARRTHVAVMFEDDQVGEVRQQLRSCLDYMGELLPRAPKEFHFVDIYNGYGDWKPFREDGRNLRLIEAFGNIYANYRWPVVVQTIPGSPVAQGLTLLNDGRVLALSTSGVAALFNPRDHTWAAINVPSQLLTSQLFSTTLLNDGRVLVAGGLLADLTPVATVWLFSPHVSPDRAWTAAAPMSAPRAAHSATLLDDGRNSSS
jgi:hypothetical protein